MKQSITTRVAALGAAAVTALALGTAAAAPATAATSFTRCTGSASGPIARTLKVHRTTCADGRALAKAWERGQGTKDAGSRFTLRGYDCRMRSIQTSEEDPDGTAHFDCRKGSRRIVWTYHP